ncbi:MAG: DedA family protein [Gemmatimonadota bacterium]
MQETLDWLFGLLDAVPVEAVYVLVGVGAAVENVFPPVPSDTFVVLGGILADRGMLVPELVFGIAWSANLSLAIGVYAMGVRYGHTIFQTGWGHWLLRPHQLRRLAAFYARHGTLTVLVSRFFPVFRVLVPAFAGVSRLGFWRTTIPLGLASALWYGLLVWVGMLASRNLPRLAGWFERANTSLLIAAGLLAAVVFVWWWRTRHREREDRPSGEAGVEPTGPGEPATPEPAFDRKEERDAGGNAT